MAAQETGEIMAGRIGILEEMTLREVRELAPNTALLPLGSTEPHGDALPYGTDTITATGVSHRATLLAVDRGARVVCYPALPITLNNNFRKFPFACRMGVSTFMALLVDIAKQAAADGVRALVLMNAHGGNTDVIRAALRELSGLDDVPFVCAVQGMASADVLAANVEHASDHAGEAETSSVLNLRPELVRTELLTDNPRRFPKLKSLANPKVAFVRPWHLYLPASAGGEARYASAEKGRAVLESAAENIAELLVELSAAPDSPDFPY